MYELVPPVRYLDPVPDVCSVTPLRVIAILFPLMSLRVLPFQLSGLPTSISSSNPSIGTPPLLFSALIQKPKK